MRLFIYSQDGMGLGHLRRTRNIAEQVLRLEPESRVLAVADAPAAPFFSRLPGLAYAKIPTIVKTGSSSWTTGSPEQTIAETTDARARQLLGAFREFEPDAVLVDHMPVGARGELKPLLECLSEMRERPALMLGLRDILDLPEVIHETWTSLGVFEALPLYDEVLIHGSKDVFDTASVYDLASGPPDVGYTQYVTPSSQPAEGRTQSEGPLLLMMGGGGADAFPLARAFVDAIGTITRTSRVRAVVLTGPNMPVHDRQEISKRASTLPIEVQTSVTDARSWMSEADAIVTMGGYNSLCEVLQLEKRALVVPRAGPSAEQRMRGRLFADLGLIRYLDPGDLAPEIMAESLQQLLEERTLPDPERIPPLDGALQAAAAILDRVSERRAGTRRPPVVATR